MSEPRGASTILTRSSLRPSRDSTQGLSAHISRRWQSLKLPSDWTSSTMVVAVTERKSNVPSTMSTTGRWRRRGTKIIYVLFPSLRHKTISNTITYKPYYMQTWTLWRRDRYVFLATVVARTWYECTTRSVIIWYNNIIYLVSNINNNNIIRFGPVRLYKTIDAVDGLRSTYEEFGQSV
jgi:hypothetical protein